MYGVIVCAEILMPNAFLELSAHNRVVRKVARTMRSPLIRLTMCVWIYPAHEEWLHSVLCSAWLRVLFSVFCSRVFRVLMRVLFSVLFSELFSVLFGVVVRVLCGVLCSVLLSA